MEEKLPKHTLGICAMKKKIHSPHMQQILEFISSFNDFELIEFTEELIFNEEVEKWPVVESMIVFFSTGFPYSKVLKYINLRKPFLPNNFEMQKIFWDRIKVMNMLKENNIPIPNEIIVEREEEINNEDENDIELNTSNEIEDMIENYYKEYDEENKPKAPALIENVSESNKSDETSSTKLDNVEKIITKNEKGEEVINELEEYDEYIVYNGRKIMKPFVEKPRNGDDHNIYIYYPMSHGGGQTRLFRKTRDLSSLYYPNINKIRRDKSYIYEEYLQTDGFDIKVYTVGENYAHAEARKSPSLDGIVERSKGKEVRYPVNLNPEEKEIARKIVKIFKQNICGFDILRSKGVSYVCDVNGWSFVKGNKKYFQDCAILLRKIILSNIDPNLLIKHPINIQIAPVYKEMILRNNTGRLEEELHSVVAVFRHADRSPKQKMKFVVEHPALLELFEIFKESNSENEQGKPPQELKLKKPNELMTVLKIVKNILFEKGIKGDELTLTSDNFDIKLFQIKLILEKNLNFEGLTRKIQIRPLEWKFVENKITRIKECTVTKALMIMKWGGHITHSGIEQAKLLGNTFRYQFYPPGNNDKGEGLLRLHNTYRHDLKCYSSEEGRCLKSAAAFLQGLLQLEGNLIPIITSMVWKDERINKLLDVNSTYVEPFRKEVKKNLNKFCNYNGPLKEKYLNFINNENRKEQVPFINLTEEIGNFHNKMVYIHSLLDKIVNHLSTKLDSEEMEKECHTYYIQNKISVLSRYDSDVKDSNLEANLIKKEKKKYKLEESKDQKSIRKAETNLEKIEEKEKEIEKEKDKDKEKKKSEKEKDNLSDSSKSLGDTAHKAKKKKVNNQIIMDCEEEKIVLIYKRYVKLFNDFYDKKKEKFDISKIPDIYDNIKYDIIHNKAIIGETAFELHKTVNNLADFVMPLEYGIKIDEKINIGIKFIKPLLSKIYNDLLWSNREALIKKKAKNSVVYENTNFINKNLESLESQERTYFGLDEGKLDKTEIKSAWRHIKTRFYFTSQSHLYSLLNTLIYSMNSFLVDNGKSINPIWSVFDLDYLSHIVFRLFENYNVDKKSEERFRIEIIVSAGMNKDISKADSKHMVSMNPWIILNDHLSLQALKKYFNFIMGS